MNDRRVRGERLIEEAEKLILETLTSSPTGMTNAEIARSTGLDVPISKQTTYITWTLLQHLLDAGQITREGKRYHAADPDRS